ncbi:MAG: tol-pal system-associated acyl-CoA thioesterase [Rhodospirillaceae bacterium]|nr:tol-pal system-associated acyl-CoA thioesterase [Rhodospirillaceae bacterium]MBT6117283.1 tol-pal system-associated acyl-CoA thioesterase [Rhodospirillaceae bacterium]
MAEDGGHLFPVRVYWEDTDAAGIVYYANYLKFAERARSDLLRCFGIGQAELKRDEDIVFVVRRCEVDYLKPARLDDDLEVWTQIIALHGASLSADQDVRRAGENLARLKIRLACLDGRGKPARVPAAVKAVIQPQLTASMRAR